MLRRMQRIVIRRDEGIVGSLRKRMTPRVTRVAAWIRADTGVGPSIA